MTASLSNNANTGAHTGRSAESPRQIPLTGWKQVALRTWKQSSEDNVGLVAAGVAFYGFLALVPLLGATVLTYGMIADPQTVMGNMKSLTSVMPADAAKLIGAQLMSVVQTSGGKKGFGIIAALALAIFGARNAAGSVVTALNIAYEEEETRGFLKVTLLSLAITAAAVVMAVLALLAVTALAALQKLFPQAPGVVLLLGKVGAFVALLLGAAAAAGTLYRYAPNRTKAKWQWITAGSVFAALAWLVLTLGFGFYTTHFANYNNTYGSLSTVVILITWMYLSSFVFLFGAELNSELEHQTAKDTTVGGDKPLGSRRAWSADHVAGNDDSPKTDGTSPTSGEAQHDVRSAPAVAVTQPKQDSWSAADYLTGRATNRAASIAGLRKVGMMCAALSTLGLSLMRKRGREGAGAALLAAAAGLSLLKRERARQHP